MAEPPPPHPERTVASPAAAASGERRRMRSMAVTPRNPGAFWEPDASFNTSGVGRPHAQGSFFASSRSGAMRSGD